MAQANSGKLELIFGPMFAGKSTELLRRIRRYTVAGKRCLTVKSASDVRYSLDEMTTHDLQAIAATRCDMLEEVLDSANHYDCIAIDEGQFVRTQHTQVHSYSKANLGHNPNLLITAV